MTLGRTTIDRRATLPQLFASGLEVAKRGRDLPGAPLPPEGGVDVGGLEDRGRLDAGGGAIALEFSEEVGHGAKKCSINAALATAFMLLHADADMRHSPQAMSTPDAIRDWMLETLAAKEWSPRRWAIEAGLTPSTVQRAVKPDYPYVTSTKTLAALAAAANVAMPSIEGAASASLPTPASLPVLGYVQAGMWAAVDDLDQDEPKYLPAARDPRFPTAMQYLLEVRGDSMNALTMNGRPAPIFEGDLVHCVRIADTGYVPQTGDVIEFERIRAGGHLREVTLKQVEVTQEGVLLWPRSTNAKWRDPVRVDDGTDADEEIEGRIRGLVLTVMRRFSV